MRAEEAEEDDGLDTLQAVIESESESDEDGEIGKIDESNEGDEGVAEVWTKAEVDARAEVPEDPKGDYQMTRSWWERCWTSLEMWRICHRLPTKRQVVLKKRRPLALM